MKTLFKISSIIGALTLFNKNITNNHKNVSILPDSSHIGKKNLDIKISDRAIRCSAFLNIETNRPEMSGLVDGDDLMKRMHEYYINQAHNTKITKPHIDLAQKHALTMLSIDYVNNKSLGEEYRECLYWMTDLAGYVYTTKNDYIDTHSDKFLENNKNLFSSAPIKTFTSNFTHSIDTFNQEVDKGFKALVLNDKPNPLKENIRKKLNL